MGPSTRSGSNDAPLMLGMNDILSGTVRLNALKPDKITPEILLR